MLAQLRLRRNRPYLHAVLAAGLFAWLAFLVSATCAMPAKAMPELMQDCEAQAGHTGHPEAPSKLFQTCAFKPCLDSQPDPAFPASVQNGDGPTLALFLSLILGVWLSAGFASRIPRGLDPPAGKRIPLIYRFCTLLN